MKKKGYDWENNQDMIYLTLIIMKYIKKNFTITSIEQMRDFYKHCASIMTMITGTVFRGSQIEGQCFFTGDFKLNKAKLRNLKVALEIGFLDSESFEKDVLGLREKKVLKRIVRENEKVISISK